MAEKAKDFNIHKINNIHKMAKIILSVSSADSAGGREYSLNTGSNLSRS